jgi:DNA-binding CsgD family transcriptional regulator
MVLTEAGELAAAEPVCTAGLASCRDVGDLGNLGYQLWNRAILDLRTGRIGDATAHLHEQLQIAIQTGLRLGVLAGLDCCGYLCAGTRRPAEAVTVWAAMSALAGPWPLPIGPRNPGERDGLLQEARQLLGPDGTRAAQERGAAMSLATAAEYALMLAAPAPQLPAADPAAAALPAAERTAATESGLDKLSPRERELVTLVAQGRTDAQIAAQLYISARTVTSHLDRIRDKTGCRRRADLTRLALSAGLV